MADDDRIAIDDDLVREAAMHAVEAQQMRIGLDRAEVVDCHNVNVFAAGLYNGAQHKTPDSSEAVDCNPYRHCQFSLVLTHAERARLRPTRLSPLPRGLCIDVRDNVQQPLL